MVDFSVDGGILEIRVRGVHKLWALKSRIRLPLAGVRDVRHDPDVARTLWKGWRLPGTHVPGLITAGTFYRGGEREFWDVRRPRRVVVVELEAAAYDRLIVETNDPAAAVRMIDAARQGGEHTDSRA